MTQRNERKIKEILRQKTSSKQFIILNIVGALIFTGFYAMNLTIGFISENNAVELVRKNLSDTTRGRFKQDSQSFVCAECRSKGYQNEIWLWECH